MTRYPRTVCELYIQYIQNSWKMKMMWLSNSRLGCVLLWGHLFSTYWTPIEMTNFGQLNLRQFRSEWSAHQARSMLTWPYLFESIACPQFVCTAISNHKKKFVDISSNYDESYVIWPIQNFRLLLKCDSHDFHTAEILLYIFPHFRRNQVGFGNVAGVCFSDISTVGTPLLLALKNSRISFEADRRFVREFLSH